MKKFILVSKDAMCRDYLSLYGKKNGQSATPNIDELAANGTVFTSYTIAAPSTVMAFFSMITGMFAHETDYEMYERKHVLFKGNTLFTKVKDIGYEECHVIWDPAWDPLVDYFDCYRGDVEIHSIDGFRQKAGVHKDGDYLLKKNEKDENDALALIENCLKNVLKKEISQFVWLHLPHVIKGKTCYGSDIDTFDKCVGIVRRYFSDDEIAVTADHGNMNGHHGKLAYGYDVYDTVIKIPLITPRLSTIKVCDTNVSSVDLYSILFERTIPKREFIYCDTAYRAQKHRKLAIISGDYKYTYNKKNGNEELFDLNYDPDEHFNLISERFYDVDRKIYIDAREEYFYPYWDKLPAIREKFRKEKERIWRNGSFKVIMKSNIKDFIRPLYERLIRLKIK